jgi:hypothetical protein
MGARTVRSIMNSDAGAPYFTSSTLRGISGSLNA